MLHILNVLNSTLSSTLRGWRGTSSSRQTLHPEKPLILFDREGDAECRLVREAVTSLNLDVTIMPCPLGGKNLRYLRNEAGSEKVPVLYDSNVEERRSGAKEIIRFLFLEYRNIETPEKYLFTDRDLKLSQWASYLRFNAGINAKPAQPAAEPLTLYSFESSPYSRLVRERLCELELPYHLVNLGKQQTADMGPAKMRLTLKPYKPLPNTKREAFFEKYGNVQVPFLVDPNTHTEMFESKDILRYLDETYLNK